MSMRTLTIVLSVVLGVLALLSYVALRYVTLGEYAFGVAVVLALIFSAGSPSSGGGGGDCGGCGGCGGD